MLQGGKQDELVLQDVLKHKLEQDGLQGGKQEELRALELPILCVRGEAVAGRWEPSLLLLYSRYRSLEVPWALS